MKAPTLAAVLLAAVLLAAPAWGANPSVIYVHGLGESACDTHNMTQLLQRIAERLPQDGLASSGKCDGKQGTANPLRFHYADDKGGNQDRSDGGTSGSGVERNADALHDLIDRLAQGSKGKVMLVGFSEGGLIIRRYLALHRDHANDRVAAVVFIESAHQGSALAPAAAEIGHGLKATPYACFASPAGPLGPPLCALILEEIKKRLNLPEPNSNALRDLTPGGAAIKANAEAPLPSSPRYLNIAGSVRLALPKLGLGEWTLGGGELNLGDLVIPAGSDDPKAVPPLGGTRFLPAGGEQDLLPFKCTIGHTTVKRLTETLIGLSPEPLTSAVARKVLADDYVCLRDAPPAHWNINAKLGETPLGETPAGTGTDAATRVVDFLVDACRRTKLYACAPPSPVESVPWSSRAYEVACQDVAPRPFKVTLRDGEGRGGPDSSHQYGVRLRDVAIGDLTPDPGPEAAVMLACTPAPGANYGATEVQVFRAGPELVERLHPPALTTSGFVPLFGDNTFSVDAERRLLTDAVYWSGKDIHAVPSVHRMLAWTFKGGKFGYELIDIAPEELGRYRVTLDGIGPLRIGMTSAEVEAWLGGTDVLGLSVDPESRCGYGWPLGQDAGLGLMFRGTFPYSLARVDVTSPSRIRTQSGVGVGSTEAEVKRLYAGKITVRPHPYEPGGHYLVYKPTSTAGTDRLLIFETDGHVVTSYRAGSRKDVELIEGCS